MELHVKSRWERLIAALKAPIGRLFREFRILLRALAHPGVPWYAKLVCGCAVLYVVSPIQLIPNFIPIIGQMDDVLVIGLSIKLLKRSVPSIVLDECQNASPATFKSAIQLDISKSSSPDLHSSPDLQVDDSAQRG
jgi:uncharacterized membrane protein YkvA (DUF1232 family)